MRLFLQAKHLNSYPCTNYLQVHLYSCLIHCKSEHYTKSLCSVHILEYIIKPFKICYSLSPTKVLSPFNILCYSLFLLSHFYYTDSNLQLITLNFSLLLFFFFKKKNIPSSFRCFSDVSENK